MVIPMSYRTPLMLACAKSSLEMVHLLVESGASLSLFNKDGWTPFHIAARCVFDQPLSTPAQIR